METSFNCAMWCSSTMYQKINSSIISKGTMNSFKQMFPLAKMFPPAVMTLVPQFSVVNLLCMVVIHFCTSSFSNPHFWQHFFDNITPMKYGINTKINAWGKVVSSCLESYKKILLDFLFITNTFIWINRLKLDFK